MCSSIPIHTCAGIDAERRYTWCNFLMNNLEDHPTFLADIIWTDEACLSRNGMFNRQNVHTWSLKNRRYAVAVRHLLILMFGAEFLMTGSSDQYFTRER
ncbi:hypothetical protein AVEN_243145-1 [Araneus ventricosus]|uniref:PiggyBac transposable element-derived protein domain-containing protein n=1 Tax=Araneus ventricosus TaxID=182803 RepID=A0A4Y2TVI0_ARAVE|nr:hypothetical protein AVEN_243145-1 [Araneus ventricosus]